jgi:hypothetical protein
MQIVWVAIWLAVQQSYGLRVEAFKKYSGSRPGGPVPLAVRAERTVYD